MDHVFVLLTRPLNADGVGVNLFTNLADAMADAENFLKEPIEWEVRVC